uniref:Uncharacterized protein n=1 Tax=Rhizophora mucronata TaxID=61149 RepID=A0A2P2PHZ4_RHIMU
MANGIFHFEHLGIVISVDFPYGVEVKIRVVIDSLLATRN